MFLQVDGGYDDTQYGEGDDLTYAEGYGEGYGEGDYTVGGGGSSSSGSTGGGTVSVGGGSVSVGGGSVSSSGSVGGGSASAGASVGAGSVATGGQGGIGGEADSINVDTFKEESITDYTDAELEKMYDYDVDIYNEGDKALPAETDEFYGQVISSYTFFKLSIQTYGKIHNFIYFVCFLH